MTFKAVIRAAWLLVFAILAVVTHPAHAEDDPAAAGFRTWTSDAGKQIQTKYVATEGDWVILRQDGDKFLRIKYSKLSAADQRFLLQQVEGVSPILTGLDLHMTFNEE